jgi:hypothetical protein
MLTGYISPDQHFIACPNQDVTYGAGFFDLGQGPGVIQVPDFGNRFWVYALYDGRTDEFAEIGKQYGTKPGFYLMVCPNWKGETPPASLRWCAPLRGSLRSSAYLHGRHARGSRGHPASAQSD